MLGDYIDKLNALLADQPKLQLMTLEQLLSIANRLSPSVGVPLSRYAGGVYNHFMYFDSMTPDQRLRTGGGSLLAAIDKSFGDMEKFRKRFNEAALSVFGSGYAWLVYGRRGLSVITLPNQDTPIPACLSPIMNLDVWEHAYFLMYYNKRVEYVGDWWNLANWSYANSRYADCLKNCE